MADFESFKNFSEGLKNILTLLFYGVVIFFVIKIGYPFLKDQLNNHKVDISKINAGFVELELTKISNEVNSTSRTQNVKPSDLKVDVASIPAANYLDTSLQSKIKYYWVYVGQFTNSRKWISKNFTFEQPMQKLEALNDVYKRETLPIKLTKDDWKLGKIIGLVKKNEILQVIKDSTIEDNNVWAMVQ